ncbi:MAG: hypothetical protein K8T25_01275 [Planctomycetia bacterium]|nr:hypothetical protein [Planctomycetia bacterium]
MLPVDSPAFQNELGHLLALFFDSPERLAHLVRVAADDVPDPYRRLLVHQEHMTVAVEARHESLVSVEVLNTKVTPTHYAREILLRRQTDHAVVQYGIMRVNLSCLAPDVRQEIEEQSRPLGRILVRHNVLRTIHLHGLWRVEPGEALQRHFGLTAPAVTYGRTAGIDLGDVPAVEVLEIVTPE